MSPLHVGSARIRDAAGCRFGHPRLRFISPQYDLRFDCIVGIVTKLRIAEVAELLRVSDDTVRRWVDAGRLALAPDDGGGRQVVAGVDVARFVRDGRDEETSPWPLSARNHFEGIVTEVQRDGLVAQVEVQAGPFRVVSLMTREAVDALGLAPGSLATALVKSTSVIIQASTKAPR